MKIFLTLALALTLTGCSNSDSQISQGEVVSCDDISIDQEKVSGPVVDCLDGSSEVSLASLRGPMVVNVWGSWCAPCAEEIPILRSFYEKSRGKVELVGVDVEEASAQDGRDFVVKNGMTWPNLIDAQGNSRKFFGMGVPVTWFIDADGQAVHKKIGVLKSEAELIELTAKYLGVNI
jgi:thiol-disulfide isomerase/thioredoxin